MRDEIDIHGKWVGIQTKVSPEKLGFNTHPTKKYFYREISNKFGGYDHLIIRPKSTYNKDNEKVVMWELTSSYFSDKVNLKDTNALSVMLERKNHFMIDDLFYYRSLKKGKEIPDEKKRIKSRYSTYTTSFSSFSYDYLSSRYDIEPDAIRENDVVIPNEEVRVTNQQEPNANDVQTIQAATGLSLTDLLNSRSYWTLSGSSQPCTVQIYGGAGGVTNDVNNETQRLLDEMARIVR